MCVIYQISNLETEKLLEHVKEMGRISKLENLTCYIEYDINNRGLFTYIHLCNKAEDRGDNRL